jgi:coenzyme Q-binding protein COQ10
LPTFETTRRVPYSARQMFAIVADVERYPEFLPLCEGLIVRSRQTKGDKSSGEESVLTATMTVGYGAIKESFTSRVTLRAAQNEILVAYLDGPFHHLDNRWRFRDVAGGSEIHFFIDYAFASRLLGLSMGAMFDRAVKKYAEAFEARARAVYGPPVAAPT